MAEGVVTVKVVAKGLVALRGAHGEASRGRNQEAQGYRISTGSTLVTRPCCVVLQLVMMMICLQNHTLSLIVTYLNIYT